MSVPRRPGLPWWVTDRDYTAGEEVVIGRDTIPRSGAPLVYRVAADTPRGTLLGVARDGCLHPVTA